MKTGGCPICHRYFMIFYILRERGLIDLIVTTFLPESPPKEVLQFSNGKRYPLVRVRTFFFRIELKQFRFQVKNC